MTDLKIIMRIARTDLAILFYSPIAWFILIVFSFLTTSSFTSLMENIVTDYDLSGGKEVSLSGICFLGSYRSEERRVGKECSEPCRSRWSPYH